MTQHNSPVGYGDNLRLQPQLSKIVDRAVVKFVNMSNDEPDDLKGLDDPLLHLPNPAESESRVCAFRRWHGADWWMVLSEDGGRDSTGGTVTRRVTILPDPLEPDTLNLLPDLVVTRGGARFVLADHEAHNEEFAQHVPLFGTYGLRVRETSYSALMDEVVIEPLSRAWRYASLLNPDDATVFVA